MEHRLVSVSIQIQDWRVREGLAAKHVHAQLEVTYSMLET